MPRAEKARSRTEACSEGFMCVISGSTEIVPGPTQGEIFQVGRIVRTAIFGSAVAPYPGVFRLRRQRRNIFYTLYNRRIHEFLVLLTIQKQYR